MSALQTPIRDQTTGWLTSAARSLVDIVLPPRTLADKPCQTFGLDAEGFGLIRFIAESCCDGCGMPFEFSNPTLCATCLARPRKFDRARAACVYDEHSRDLILKFKHADRTDLAPMLTSWLQRAGDDLIETADVILPVPMHPLRLMRRRYNQAAELARLLAQRTGRTYEPQILRRARDTQTQAGRSAGGRRRNVQGAFAAAAKAGLYAGKTALLVDDVLTTGATAEACASVLKAAGIAQVNLLVLARVQEIESRPI